MERRKRERTILFQLEIRKEGRLSCRRKLEQLQGAGEGERQRQRDKNMPRGWSVHQAWGLRPVSGNQRWKETLSLPSEKFRSWGDL